MLYGYINMATSTLKNEVRSRTVLDYDLDASLALGRMPQRLP
jgi:hypothetical protein